MCKTHNIHHVVNNAYGITCTKVTDLLSQANSVGRIDVIISSSDKNFMVPVGGSLLYSGDVVIIKILNYIINLLIFNILFYSSFKFI